MTTPVDNLYADYKVVSAYIDKNKEPSLNAIVEDNFRKSLLLATASFFEHTLTSNLLEVFAEISGKSEILIEFIKNKALKRQYHTLFDWETTNANKFFSLFGVRFKDYMKEEIKKEPSLEDAIRAFIEIGNDRNILVHANYAVFPVEKNVDEIYGKYKIANNFIETFLIKLRIYNGGIPNITSSR